MKYTFPSICNDKCSLVSIHLISLPFIVYSELQKYEVKHYDLRASTPTPFLNDQIPGNQPQGWIVESRFTAIPTPFQERDDIPLDALLMLGWLHCRQFHFQYDLQQQLSMKQLTIDERGLMFRDTADQHMTRIFKAIRGKINRNQLGRVISLKVHIPPNFMEFLIEPKLKAIIGCPEDEELGDGNKYTVSLTALQMTHIIPIQYTVKMYDETATAFQLDKKANIESEHHEQLHSAILSAIHQTNKRALDRHRWKMQRGGPEDMCLLRKVKYLYTINNGICIEYNYKSGLLRMRFNVFKMTLLRERSLVKSSATPIGDWQ